MVGKALLNFKLKLRWNHFNLENWHYLWEKCLYSIVKKLAQNICASFTWSSPSSHRVSGFKYFKGAKPLNKAQNRRQVKKKALKKTADILQYQHWILSSQWCLRDECKNSILMTRHYLDLSGASDWLRQISHMARPIRSTPKISVVTSMEFLCSFLRCQFVGKPVVALKNAGCFLRLVKKKTLCKFYY